MFFQCFLMFQLFTVTPLRSVSSVFTIKIDWLIDWLLPFCYTTKQWLVLKMQHANSAYSFCCWIRMKLVVWLSWMSFGDISCLVHHRRQLHNSRCMWQKVVMWANRQTNMHTYHSTSYPPSGEVTIGVNFYKAARLEPSPTFKNS